MRKWLSLCWIGLAFAMGATGPVLLTGCDQDEGVVEETDEGLEEAGDELEEAGDELQE
jgi:hypothetical protein